MRFPHFHLLTYRESDLGVFQKALKTHPLPESYKISYHTGSLRDLGSSVRFDTVVSPANSYGRMDGGFDDALSRAFSPSGNYLALTHVVQDKLWEECKGFATPGTCILVPFKFQNPGSRHNPWKCRMIAVCPTMKIPQDVRWDRQIVYECMWSLLCAIDKWNTSHEEDERIKSVLMTPLATATGHVSAERWARQVLLAMQHFDEACTNKAKWSRLDISHIVDLDSDVAATHEV